ncbi:MAG: hypothetical protein LBQ86_04165 [Holophagales bacterium]|nr:hypothetical protein [Holophagales bacterium]
MDLTCIRPFRQGFHLWYNEVIAKPPALPETRTPDPHFSGIAHWRTTFPEGFAITSNDN